MMTNNFVSIANKQANDNNHLNKLGLSCGKLRLILGSVEATLNLKFVYKSQIILMNIYVKLFHFEIDHLAFKYLLCDHILSAIIFLSLGT